MSLFGQLPPIPQPPAPMRRPTPAPLEERRGAVGRLESMTGKVHRVQGFFELHGAGEASIELDFPVWFIESPVFTFGGELMANEFPTAGAYPTISVVILGWHKKDYPEQVSYWSGAILGAVSTGSTAQKMVVHWQMEGRALRNPASDGVSDTGATI